MDMVRRLIAGVLALIVLALVLLPWLRSAERGPLDEAARRDAPGTFLALARPVHVTVQGPEHGAPVLLVHGFSVPSYVWEPLDAQLARAGFRVVSFDLYGRGFSARPDVVYDRALFARQLEQLMDTLGIQRASVIGLSMGGAVAAHFAARHPQRVDRLGLIAPLTQARDIGVLGQPLLGEWLMQVWLLPKLADSQLSDFVHPERHPGWPERFRPQMRFDGFGRALLSSLRHVMSQDSLADFGAVQDHGIATLLVWGRQDSVLPFAQSEAVRRAIPSAQWLPVDQAGHLPHREQAETVAAAVIAFLQAPAQSAQRPSADAAAAVPPSSPH
jgi:pimeloyl-ACP methyl ester carboxylesterase